LTGGDMPQNLRIFIPDPNGENSYPIVTFSWILLHKKYKNAETAKALRDLFQWSLKDGQGYASQLGYIPLPNTVVDKVQAALNDIEAEG